MENDLLSNIWVYKYMPRKLEDVVLDQNTFQKFQEFIQKDNAIPNLLFTGCQGSGKTTIGQIFCSPNGVLQYPDDNLLFINGSAQQTRSIKYVNDVIEPFLKFPPVGKDRYKIVFIDEADNLTGDSFDSYRGIIEKYKDNGRFLFTCNYLYKIPAPVRSRFQHFHFNILSVDFILNYCKRILDAEQVEYKESESDIKFTVETFHPDVRQVIQILQSNTFQGKLHLSRDKIITTEMKIVAFFIDMISGLSSNDNRKTQNSMAQIIELLKNNIGVDYANLYVQMFSSSAPMPTKIIINECANDHNSSLVPFMHFISCLFKITKLFQEYRKASGKSL